MKFLIVLSLAVVCALAAPQAPMDPNATPIPILRMEMQDNLEGQFSSSFESGNGISQQSSGQLKDLGGTEGPVQVTRGSYSFVAPDGLTYSVNWVSDENGFQPQGAHLPTSPPIPEEIQRSLAANAQEEQRMAAPRPF